ncbi:MAG: hypothetical protein EZS28_020046 [Streblomastix strix]|uniref:Uncharacterized protein n=1 Tax=Streblomastix strix TaxID=222440 RepID=A0A5J4VP64_9EUKA|nr:MAG: hypothetical protein EZS28_020046 [Streblomastix strix]
MSACFYGLTYTHCRVRFYSSIVTAWLKNRNNIVDDNSKDEEDNNQYPGFRASATFTFDQFVTAINTASDYDPDFSDSYALLSVEVDQSSEIQAFGDKQIFNEGQSPLFRRDHELEIDSDIDSIIPSEFEEVPGIKRRRLNETDSETERGISESDSIAPQDPETKSILQKLAPRPLKSEKQNRKATVRLIEAQNHQKSKDYDVLDPDLNEDHIRTLRQKSRQDMILFVFNDPPRIVEGEINSQIGNVLRNLVAAQRTSFVAIQLQFLIGKEEATERMLDTLKLISQATADTQQIRKLKLSYRNSNFSYRHPHSSTALSQQDKKLMKEEISISQHSCSRQRGSIRSFSLSLGRNSNKRGRRSFDDNYNSSK